MARIQRQATVAPRRRPPRSSPGVKREQILEVAAESFARDGFEDTRWADVANSVGVGPTALYHYFESKMHCLFVIMDEAIESFRVRFAAITAEPGDYSYILERVISDGYGISERQVLLNRVLVAEMGLLSLPRALSREEEARQLALRKSRDLEFAWGTFLARGMERGAIPSTDPRLLTHAVLGLYNSVWQWYRPGGTIPMSDVQEFYVKHTLSMLGVTKV